MEMLKQDAEPEAQKVTATFKSIKLINAQTIETVKAKTLVFKITHRFENIAEDGNPDGHSLYGFDNASNIRISFDYGVCDRLLIGIGRSKVREHIDGSLKYKILAQSTDNKMPLSVAWYSNMAVTPMKSPKFTDGTYKWTKTEHRFSYSHQLIIARKFSPGISFEILPTFVHRNLVNELVNTENGAEEQNDLFSLGFAGRVKITPRIALVADYFYTFSEFRKKNPENPYFAPLGIGVEIETGGHVFHINFSNSAGIIENDYIPDTPDSWSKGEIKFGFNISRVFFL